MRHNADLHLNFIKNTLPFDINIIPFIHNKSNQDKLVIFKIILGVFSFVCVLGIFIMIDFLLAKRFLTSKRILLLLGGIVGGLAYKFLQLYYQDDILKKYYVSPAKLSEKIHINQSKNKKNLLFIYVESLDTAFENPELFGEKSFKTFKRFRRLSASYDF